MFRITPPPAGHKNSLYNLQQDLKYRQNSVFFCSFGLISFALFLRFQQLCKSGAHVIGVLSKAAAILIFAGLTKDILTFLTVRSASSSVFDTRELRR